MKKIIIILITSVFSVFSFGQLQQYLETITPYLRDTVKSGFLYFKMPNAFQPGALYSLYKQYANDYDNDMVLVNYHIDSLAGMNHYNINKLL